MPENEERLNKLLDNPDERRQRAAVFAILLGGNLDRLDRILEILKGQESRLVLRQWYEEHPVFLTKQMFDSKRIFKRLKIARTIADKTEKTGPVLWPWKHLMDRLKNGWDTSPGGLTSLQVKHLLADTVRNDAENRKLAAEILSGLNARGILLALQSEKGPSSEVAREIIHMMNLKSQ
jgi:hypothetical protein